MTGKTRVLVVDDEPAILRFLKPALEANDYEVNSAATLAEALKRIANRAARHRRARSRSSRRRRQDVIRRCGSGRMCRSSCSRRASARPKNRSVRPWRRRLRQQAVRRRRADGAPAHGAAPSPPRRGSDGRSARRAGDRLVRRRVMRAGDGIKLTQGVRSAHLSGAACRQGDDAQAATHRCLGARARGETQYLRVYIGHLRQKIEENPDDPKIILTELGIGYRLAEGYASTYNRDVCSWRKADTVMSAEKVRFCDPKRTTNN